MLERDREFDTQRLTVVELCRTRVISIALGILGIVAAGLLVVWLVRLLAGPRFAELAVSSSPDGAMVLVDGQYRGVTPITLTNLGAGAHSLKLTKHGFQDWSQAIELAPGKDQVAAVLAPLPKASLSVYSVPSGAWVYIDSEPAGQTPVESRTVSAGTHQVRIQAANYVTWQQEVQVEPGQKAKVEEDLASRVAEYYLGQIQGDPQDLTTYTELAHHYLLEQDFEKALSTFERGLALAGQPGADRDKVRRLHQELLKVYRAQFEFGDADDLSELRPKLIELLRKAISLAPHDIETYRTLAACYRASGRHADVLELFEKALEKEPKFAEAYLELSQIYLLQRDAENAKKCLERAVEAKPENPVAHFGLAGLIFATRDGPPEPRELETIITHLQAALKNVKGRSARTTVRRQLLRAMAGAHRLDEADRLMHASLEQAEDKAEKAEILSQLATAYRFASQPDKAIEILKKIPTLASYDDVLAEVQEDPADLEEGRALRRLDKLITRLRKRRKRP